MPIDYAKEVEGFSWDIDPGFNLPDLVEDHAESFGDRTALRYLDHRGNRAERTFADVRDGMNRFANALEEEGVGRGDRVLHLLPRHPDIFAVQLGILKRGAILVPCSDQLRPKDIAFRARDCEATGIVCHADLVDMVDPVRDDTPLSTFVSVDGTPEGWTGLADLLADQATTHEGPGLGSQDPMSINYTSGTTGGPKPVQHRHRWMAAFQRINGRYWWGFDETTNLQDEMFWATTGTGWAKWFWSPVGVALTWGAPQLLYEGPFEPERFLEVMADEGVTRLCAVPTQYRYWAQLDLERYDLKLRHALSAGEPLNRPPIEAFRRAFGVTPRDGYGQTETVALVTNYPGIDVKPGSMGVPTPGLGTTIIDEDEQEVDVGTIGEIAVPVGNPGIFDSYFQRPDLDEEAFGGAYYRTGDLASRDEEGYFYFEGRADDIIISSGYRIGPFEVEDALVSHPAVAEAAAVASPHEVRGSVVKAFIVLVEGVEGSDALAKEIQDHVKEVTAPYKYPRRIAFVDELPKTMSGKIRRIELRKAEEENAEP